MRGREIFISYLRAYKRKLERYYILFIPPNKYKSFNKNSYKKTCRYFLFVFSLHYLISFLECQKFDLITRLILTEPPLDSTFIGGVNALCLQEKFPQINAVIWFQCPWPNNAEDPPYELINR